MRITYFTPSRFRTVNAGALRNVGISASLSLRGHSVVIVTSDPPGTVIEPGWVDVIGGRSIEIRAGGVPTRSGSIDRRLRRYLLGPTAEIRSILDELRPDRVLAYNPGPVAFERIRREGTARRIPVVLDVSEWLGPRDLPGGRFSPLALIYARHMRRLPLSANHSIAITEGLATHLRSGGGRSLVVPPLFEFDDDVPARRLGSAVRLLVISGGELRRGSKDALPLEALASALEALGTERPAISLDVVGPISNALRAEYARRLQPAGVVFHGPMGWRQTRTMTAMADFLVVMRDPLERRMNVGFPSKVAESLLLGTPVLANAFSDLPVYLREGENALLLGCTDTPEVIRALLRAVPLTNRRRIADEATRMFSPAAHADALNDLLEAAT